MANNKKTSFRYINIELLRVLCMFLIVVTHYLYHVREIQSLKFDIQSINDSVSYLILEALWILALTAVNCYIMITGYFLVEKGNIRWNGIIRTIIQTQFYAVVIFCIFAFVNQDFSFAYLKKALMPIHSNYYWFVTSYIGLLFIAPFLSILASNITKRQYQYLLIILFVLNFEFFYGSVYSNQRSLLWFSCLYLIAGYLKLYGTPNILIKYKGLVLVVMWIFLILLASMYNSLTWPMFKIKGSDYNGPIFFLSFTLFIYFVNTDFRRGHLLAKLAPYAFGVYLIHDNPMVRRVLWEYVILISDSIKLPIFIHCLLVCVIIFTTCVIFDFIRDQLFRAIKFDEKVDKIKRKLPTLQ